MKKIFYFLTAIPAILLLMVFGESCRNSSDTSKVTDSLAIKTDLKSPVLSATEAINKMHLEDGFEVKLVAAEPLVTAPVALNFDDKGRIWVVEMEDYMPDTLGTGEEEPLGKVVILSDRNGDGIMDERT
ncbi:MAG TPA: dehydrogenase, partial [Segetibacter sp.]